MGRVSSKLASAQRSKAHQDENSQEYVSNYCSLHALRRYTQSSAFILPLLPSAGLGASVLSYLGCFGLHCCVPPSSNGVSSPSYHITHTLPRLRFSLIMVPVIRCLSPPPRLSSWVPCSRSWSQNQSCLCRSLGEEYLSVAPSHCPQDGHLVLYDLALCDGLPSAPVYL